MLNTDQSILLQQGIEALHLPCSILSSPSATSNVIAKLLDYIALLTKWNKTYNLTAISDPQKIISHHILDSLAILPYIKGPNILDVGSGAGLPGIPLALLLPQYNFVLLDSNGKKTRFMSHVVMTLVLSNVKVVQARIEKFNFTPCFDTIVTRAFAALKDIVIESQHLCCEHGQLLAMKGKYPHEELAELKALQQKTACLQSLSISVQPIQVPQLDAERHLVCITGIRTK